MPPVIGITENFSERDTGLDVHRNGRQIIDELGIAVKESIVLVVDADAHLKHVEGVVEKRVIKE
ncbi:hypothetical protein D3C87_2176830 [compost metagenome]